MTLYGNCSTITRLIPNAAFLAFLEKHPKAALEIVRLLEKDSRRFMKLWMSAG